MNKWAAYKYLHHMIRDEDGRAALEKTAGVTVKVPGMMTMLPIALMGYGGYNIYGKARGALERRKMEKLRQAQIDAQLEAMKRQARMMRRGF